MAISRPGKLKDTRLTRSDPGRPALLDSALFQAWVEAAQEIIFVIDQSLQIEYLNPFAAHLRGSTLEGVRGTPLRNLSEHLQSMLEKEKKEISRRIRDDLGQQLTALKMDVFWLNQRLSPDQPALSEKIKSLARLIDDTIHTIQKISRELRPPLLEHLGLPAAMEWQLKDFEKRTGLKGSLIVSPRKWALGPDDSTLIFRLVQEMLTNIFRHAEAKAVKITLKKIKNRVNLTVSDNGLGIAPARIDDPRSLGLLGMRERVYARGGAIKIRGIPRRGTKIAVEIPFSREGENHDKNISSR